MALKGKELAAPSVQALRISMSGSVMCLPLLQHDADHRKGKGKFKLHQWPTEKEHSDPWKGVGSGSPDLHSTGVHWSLHSSGAP